ncbi:MAG: hypothetical protein AAF740_05535 [Bacteroidota bacterium]
MWKVLLGLSLFVLVEDTTPKVEWQMVWQKTPQTPKAEVIRATQYDREGRILQHKDFLKGTSKQYVYDTAGQVIEETGEQNGWGRYKIEYDKDFKLRTEYRTDNSEREIYQFYNDKNKIYDERHYQNDSVQLHIVYKYNAFDSLEAVSLQKLPWQREMTTGLVEVEYNPQTKKPTARYEYDFDGFLVEETYYEYKYGVKLIGKKVITHAQSEKQGDGKIRESGNTETIEYEVQYHHAKEPKETDLSIPEKNYRETEIFAYDDDNRLLKSTKTVFQDGVPQQIITSNHAYTPEGIPSQVVTTAKRVDGSTISTHTKTFNEIGKPKSEVLQNPDGETRIDYLYVYYRS